MTNKEAIEVFRDTVISLEHIYHTERLKKLGYWLDARELAITALESMQELEELREQVHGRYGLMSAIRESRGILGDFKEPWTDRETRIDKVLAKAMGEAIL